MNVRVVAVWAKVGGNGEHEKLGDTEGGRVE
jgi:hypothetical protein